MVNSAVRFGQDRIGVSKVRVGGGRTKPLPASRGTKFTAHPSSNDGLTTKTPRCHTKRTEPKGVARTYGVAKICKIAGAPSEPEGALELMMCSQARPPHPTPTPDGHVPELLSACSKKCNGPAPANPVRSRTA